MSQVLTIGEPLVVLASTQIDIPLEDVTNFDKYLAGSELNVAVGLARLGHSVQYISQVGTDPFGKFVKKEIEKNGIGVDYLRYDDKHWTGHQTKELVSEGDPYVYNYRTNSAASFLDQSILDNLKLSDVKIAHLTGIFPAISDTAYNTVISLIDLLKKNNILITFDPNLRPALWDTTEKMRTTLNYLASKCDIILPGINEGKILTGSSDPDEIADFYLINSSTKAVITKLGPTGAYVKEKNESGYKVSGFKATVKDTVGAGDGFALGFISGLLDQLSFSEAVKRANAVGALQVQTYGDNDGYPTPAELAQFMNNWNKFNNKNTP